MLGCAIIVKRQFLSVQHPPASRDIIVDDDATWPALGCVVSRASDFLFRRTQLGRELYDWHSLFKSRFRDL